MKTKNKKFQDTGRLALVLALLALGQGCVPPVLVVRTPQQVAQAHDLTLSPGEAAAYRDALEKNPKGKQAAMACYFLGSAALQAKDWAEAETYFKRCRTAYPGTGWDADAAFMQAESLEKQGRVLDALAAYGRIALAQPGYLSLPSQATEACLRLAAGLDPAGLDKAAALGAALPDEAQAGIQFRRLEALSSAGQLDAFLSGMQDFYQKHPQSLLRPKVDALAKEAFRKVAVEPRVIGLLAPLAGDVGPDGQEVVNGAQLALDKANESLPLNQRFKLVVEEEGGGNTTLACAAARKLIEQDKVIGVLGPMFSVSAAAVAPLSASRRVPFLTSSALKAGLTDLSPFLFRNAMTNEKQGAFMADYALLDRRVTRVAALYPGTPYGNSLVRSFARRYTELGGVVAAEVSFTAGARDFKDAMLALGGADPSLSKEADVESRKELQQKVEKASSGLGDTLIHLADVSRTALAVATPEAAAPRAGVRLPTPTPTPLIKLVVLDFSCDTVSASFNTGRVISDRFRRTLELLQPQGIEVIAAGPTNNALKSRGLRPEDLNPSSASEIARSLGASFVLGGSVGEEAADFDDLAKKALKKGEEGRKAQREIELFRNSQVFEVNAQLIDALSTSLAAYQQFEFSRLKPLTSNARVLQGLYLPCSFEDAVLIAPTMLSFDLKVPLFGSDSWQQPGLLRDTEYLEGAVFTSGFFADSPSPQVQAFVKAFQKRYAVMPGVLAAQSFDACGLLIRLVENGATNREDLRDTLESLRGYEGVTGETTFGGNRDAYKKLPVIEVRNGEFTQIK